MADYWAAQTADHSVALMAALTVVLMASHLAAVTVARSVALMAVLTDDW